MALGLLPDPLPRIVGFVSSSAWRSGGVEVGELCMGWGGRLGLRLARQLTSPGCSRTPVRWTDFGPQQAPTTCSVCTASSWRSPASPFTAFASRTFSAVQLGRSGRRVIAHDDCLASPLAEATDQRVHFVGNRAGFDDSNRSTKRQSDYRHDEPIELVGAESNRARVSFGVDGRVVDP